MHLVEAEPERLSEVELEQPVVPDHLERDPLARRRERHAAVGRVLGELERGELLHHRARRGRGHVQPLRERGDRHTLPLLSEQIDGAQVVLDCLGQRGLHVCVAV